MFALFTEVNADEAHADYARQTLPTMAVPAAREKGAVAGYWLTPKSGRGVAVVVFETESAARDAAALYQVGEPPFPNAPPGITVRTVEVREILASFTV